MHGEPTTLQATFRSVMAGVCTPVSVVTTLDPAGQPHGMTVSAFASLSMEPPMVLVSLDVRSSLLPVVERSGYFGINVLAADQADIATRFATKGVDRFRGVSRRSDSGSVRLDGASAWLACRLVDVVPGGDHRILLGEVVSADASGREPLTYHERTFGTHRSHEAEAPRAMAGLARS